MHSHSLQLESEETAILKTHEADGLCILASD
jgi:hypothetical protein